MEEKMLQALDQLNSNIMDVETAINRVLGELIQVNVTLGSLAAMEEERREAEKPSEALAELLARRAGVPGREEPSEPVRLEDLPFYRTKTGGFLIRNMDGSSRPPNAAEAYALSKIGQRKR